MSYQNKCSQCGICCEKGGPALHSEDLPLIKNGLLSLEKIITIRKGEFVHDPVTNSIGPSKTEILKISGTKGLWTCIFYNKSEKNCSIYDHRPLACRVLKCWDTDDILKLSGTDLISRLDVVAEDNPLRRHLIENEELFACPDLKTISKTITRSSKKAIKKLENIINKDLSHRLLAIDGFHLSVAQELFYFGRPIFQLLEPFGFIIRETPSGVKLQFKG